MGQVSQSAQWAVSRTSVLSTSSRTDSALMLAVQRRVHMVQYNRELLDRERDSDYSEHIQGWSVSAGNLRSHPNKCALY